MGHSRCPLRALHCGWLGPKCLPAPLSCSFHGNCSFLSPMEARPTHAQLGIWLQTQGDPFSDFWSLLSSQLFLSGTQVPDTAKAKCWTLPELQSLCPQLCETSCPVWLPCSALGFGNCFQESWAIIGFILFLPPCLRDQSPVLLALQHLKAVFHTGNAAL